MFPSACRDTRNPKSTDHPAPEFEPDITRHTVPQTPVFVVHGKHMICQNTTMTQVRCARPVVGLMPCPKQHPYLSRLKRTPASPRHTGAFQHKNACNNL